MGDQKETDEPVTNSNETVLSEKQLNKLCSRDGRKSETVSRACDVIVNHLKETFDNILCSNNEVIHIYPAFKVGKEKRKENEIIFVVTLSKKTDISVLCDEVAYSVEIRVLHKFSNELKTLMDTIHEEGHSISSELQRTIARTIGEWSNSLLDTHTYLTVITASPLKSKRNNDSNEVQAFVRERECCIVFCVHAKDFVYIKEDPLPEKLNGISTDVMEGAFVTFGLLAHESHENLPLGCEIGRVNSKGAGTLGGFIDHPEYGLCGITSGHFCMDPAEYMACVKNDGRLTLKQWPTDSNGREICQLSPKHNGNTIGRIVEFLYKEGGPDESGYDVVLFKIEKTYKAEGIFPSEIINEQRHDVAHTFKSGDVLGARQAADETLWKFGLTSGSTTGKAQFEAPLTSVKKHPMTFKYKPNDFRIRLHNQFHVSSIDKEVKFATSGDSGALVFIGKDKDDLKCVGMVAGGIPDTGIVFVSSMFPILKQCNVTNFYSFYNTPKQNSEAIQRIETTCLQLDEQMKNMAVNVGEIVEWMRQQNNNKNHDGICQRNGQNM